jgi:hypothetical protein
MSVDSQLRVVDSFLGWARYAAALGRQELLELAAHALTQHLEVAATRWVAWQVQHAGERCGKLGRLARGRPQQYACRL